MRSWGITAGAVVLVIAGLWLGIKGLKVTMAPTEEISPTDALLTPSTCAVTFGVIADSGTAGEDAAAVAKLVKSWQPDFIATAGDVNYPNGEASTIDGAVGQYYGEYVVSKKFFSALGNHDWHTAGAKPYLDYFSLPGNERYYDVAVGPVQLFILDSSVTEPDGITATSKQALWLKDQLAQSTAAWKIVIMHHPPYASTTNHGADERLRWPFKEWGADIVLSAHMHVYERLAVDGLPYVIIGPASQALYGFTNTIAPGSKVRFRDDYGALKVTASLDKLTATFITKTGKIVDTLELSKETKAECGLML